MNILNLSCKKATRLMSEAQDRELSLAERSALQAHLLICRGCRAVNGQFQALRRGLQRLFDEQT